MRPFLAWAGGKRWLVANHSTWLRHGAKRYIEPFLGSGAVFFYLRPASAVLSDLNHELVLTYEVLRETPDLVFRHLRRHHRLHSHAHYYSVRDSRPRSKASRAARFIYLNRTCFNGLYRVNRQGSFNVPVGTKENVILPTDDFKAISCALQGAELAARDFAETIRLAREGDFLYVDPPYTVRHNSNGFVKYNEKIFSWGDQRRLADSLAEAASRGACILLSNADHASVHELYAAPYWTHLTVHRTSRLASSPLRRKATTETVISNYLSEDGTQEDPRY